MVVKGSRNSSRFAEPIESKLTHEEHRKKRKSLKPIHIIIQKSKNEPTKSSSPHSNPSNKKFHLNQNQASAQSISVHKHTRSLANSHLAKLACSPLSRKLEIAAPVVPQSLEDVLLLSQLNRDRIRRNVSVSSGKMKNKYTQYVRSKFYPNKYANTPGSFIDDQIQTEFKIRIIGSLPQSVPEKFHFSSDKGTVSSQEIQLMKKFIFDFSNKGLANSRNLDGF